MEKHQLDFDLMNSEYQAKLAELEEIRMRANDEISKLSSEFSEV